MAIKLNKSDKRYIENTEDVYNIMQRILLRENKIDQEKEHLWTIGLNQAGYILYIELVSLGSFKETVVEPMNVFRVAVLKGAVSLIIVHNHPAGSMTPSDADKDITDRLIQVGKILNIRVQDHLIITPTTYISFRAFKLMDELEKSVKYIPNYQLVEQIRKEEKTIAKQALKAANDRADKILTASIDFFISKDIPIKQIAEILGITQKKVKDIINNKK